MNNSSLVLKRKGRDDSYVVIIEGSTLLRLNLQPAQVVTLVSFTFASDVKILQINHETGEFKKLLLINFDSG